MNHSPSVLGREPPVSSKPRGTQFSSKPTTHALQMMASATVLQTGLAEDQGLQDSDQCKRWGMRCCQGPTRKGSSNLWQPMPPDLQFDSCRGMPCKYPRC